MYRACARCGKIHQKGERCPRWRPRSQKGRRYETTEERKLRSTYAWTLKSIEVREKANYLCEVCRDQNKITYDDIEVHHIVKVREDGTGLLDNRNLVCLCQEHHKKADKGQIPSDYLKELAEKRESR